MCISDISASHRVGDNRKRYQQATNADKKSIKTVFSIAIVASLFSNDFRSTFLDSIDVFDCRLPGVSFLNAILYKVWNS